MKNLIRLFTGILILSLALTGCKKDKDKNDVANFFKVGSTTHTITFGTLENYGADPESYAGFNLDLTLISGIDVDEYGDWSGSGKAIYFETYSTSSTNLPSGEYTYDYISDIPPTYTFDFCDYCTNWTESTHTWVLLVAGTLTVTRDGSYYEINLTGGVDQNGTAVTAHYSGTLEYFDYSKKKSEKVRH